MVILLNYHLHILLLYIFYINNNIMEEIIDILNNFEINNKNKINNKEIFNLLTYEYVIFLGNTYYNFFNKNLLYFFSKCKILYFSYYDKEKILNQIDKINNFIKFSEKNNKDYIIEKLNLKKLKLIYFFENKIELNTLYKKIKFAREELFLTFDKFSIKNIEYKLKAFSQIAEKMGATNIEIDYNNDNKSLKKISLGLQGLNNGGEIGSKNKEETNENIKFNFDYTKKNYNFNLNKFDLIDTINKENEFFITKEEFESDIDLKFLIDSRCINLIKKYDTCLIFKNVSELERKLSIKAKSFGLNMDYISNNISNTSIKINIEFVNIYDFPKSINGYNIYNLKEGFFHLSNLIKNESENKKVKEIKENFENILLKEDIYIKINNFLYSHLKSLKEKKFIINLNYHKKKDIIKAYNIIINSNFSKIEIKHLFYSFFNNNLNYEQFKIFRNIILDPTDNFYDILLKYNYYGNIKNDNGDIIKYNFYENIINGKDNYLDKLIFISYQYHLIVNTKIEIIDYIEITINNIFTNIEEEIDEQKDIVENYNKFIEEIEDDRFSVMQS